MDTRVVLLDAVLVVVGMIGYVVSGGLTQIGTRVDIFSVVPSYVFIVLGALVILAGYG